MEIKHADGRALLATLLALAAGAFAAAPATGSQARLIGPGSLCIGVEGTVSAGAAVVLESCDGEAEQIWKMPARGDHGTIEKGGGLCLDGREPRLADCGALTEFGNWAHGTDGLLMSAGAPYGPRPISGQCLDAAAGLAVVPCSGAASQLFFAEGQDAWTYQIASGPSPFLPVETSFASIQYGRSSSAHLRSENYGRSYQPFRAAKASDAFAVSPFDPYRLWLISGTTLERSRDGGRRWTPVAQLPIGITGASPRIAPSRVDESRVYVYGLGLLWASRDGGQTFAERGRLPLPQTSETQLLNAGGGDLLFLRVNYCIAACEPQNVRLWRSSDEGASWQEVLSRESAVNAVWLAADPHRPGDYYLTSRPSGAANDALLRSTDGGRTFAEAGGLPSRDGRLVFDRDVPGRRYLFQKDGFWRSQGSGEWLELASPLDGFGANDAQLMEFGGGFLRIVGVRAEPRGGLRAVYYDSHDAGDTFTRYDPAGFGQTGDLPLPVAFAGERGVFYHLDGATLRRTEDGGATFRNGARLWGAQEILVDPRDADRVFALLPSGLQLSEDGGASFAAVAGPAGSATALAVLPQENPAPGSMMIVAATVPSFQLSKDGGRTWSAMPSPRPLERFKRLTGNERVIFAVGASDELFRTYDEGETWETLGVAAENPTFGWSLLAYVREHDGTLRVSLDGGDTFVDRYPPDVANGGRTFHIDPRGTIYLAGATTVLRSSDWGATWQSLGRDLFVDEGPRAAVFADPFEEGKLYRSSAIGLQVGRFSATPPLDLGSRFEARVQWRDYLGQEGEGMAQALTRDSGLFWLFTPGRAEVSVKVLDGRAINGKFWVFVASMTDVELDLEVEDRATGEIWTYHNPLGRLLSFGDIEAFPRAEADPAEAAPPASGGVLQGTAERVTLAGRFEVAVDFAGAAGFGKGQGRRLNAESAAFYFFDRANVELIVNLLDGRPINGKYWVYFGSMSDVAYTMTIKDLASGRVKTYSNPAGAFASRGDVDAFE